MKNAHKSPPTRANGRPRSRKELLAAHERALKRMNQMTASEGFEMLVDAGIYTADGKLTKRYGGKARNRTAVSD